MTSLNDYFKGLDFQNDEHYAYEKLKADLIPHLNDSKLCGTWYPIDSGDVEFFLEKVEYTIDLLQSRNDEVLKFLEVEFNTYMENENERRYDNFVDGFYGG